MQQREARDHNVRRIEYMIRHEKEITQAVDEAKHSPRGHSGGAATGHSFVSDPTAAQAIRLADELTIVQVAGRDVFYPERWLKVISALRSWCGRDNIRAEIFRRKYHTGEGYHRTCFALHIAERTYYDILAEIRGYALQCAAQAQVVKVF